jgi:hypothetical protein
MNQTTLPLKNKNGEIIENTVISSEDYQILSKFKWYLANNYVVSEIDGKSWRLHRYIMIIILKNDLTPKNYVDHINNNTLDNTRNNLRVVTASENARNIKKRENATSKYLGVSFEEKSKKWITSIRINLKHYTGIYDNEIHAAWHYNLCIDEFELRYANKNEIEEPENFIKWKAREKELPVGISMSRKKFRSKITIENTVKILGYFDNLEDAIKIRKIAEKEKEVYLKDKLLSIPKLFNEKNECIFKVKEHEILIDEEIYYDIIKYKWNIWDNDEKKNISGLVDGKNWVLSRYIMNYTGENFIDHINNNKLDNRRSNLRIATVKQNAMNKSSSKNSTSKYIGISLRKSNGTWNSHISVDGKKLNLGTFKNEIDAAKARDIATKKYFGEYGNLNFPEEQ